MRTFVNMKWRFILLGVALGWAQQLQCYTVDDSDLPGNAILSIYVDGSDTAWIGTDNGLTWYANGTLRSNAMAGANWISECTKAPNGAVWCAFYNLGADGGVFRYHNGRLTWYRKNAIAPSYWRASVLGRSIAMEGNTVWVGLFRAGLAKYDGTTWSWYHPQQTAGMPDSTVLAIAVDAQGRKWLGTDSRGVVIFDGSTWTQVGPTGSGPISDILITPSGDIYVAAQNGFYKYGGAPNTWQTLSSTRGYALAYDGSVVWIGTTSGGVARYDGTTLTTFLTTADGLPSNSIRSIGRRGSGPLYIGTLNNGVCVYNFLSSALGKSLPSEKALSVYPMPVRERLYVQAGEEDVEQVRLFSPVGDVVVSNLPHRRQRDGVYEIELPLTLPTGFYILEVTGRKGWQAQAKVLIGTP